MGLVRMEKNELNSGSVKVERRAKCVKCGTVVKCLKGDCEMGTCPLCGWDVYFS